MEKQITLIIPTKNHPQYIKTMLSTLNVMKPQISVLVMDSGKNNQTCAEVNSYQRPYWRYCAVDPEWSADRKTMFALGSFETEYGWIVGDGVIPDLTVFASELQQLMQLSFDVIHLTNQDSFDIRRYYKSKKFCSHIEYTDAVALFRDFFWTMTFMGATIVHRRVAKLMLHYPRGGQYAETGFEYVCTLFHLLEKTPFRAIVKKSHYYLPNPEKKESIWMSTGQMFQIWCRNMPMAVEHLPVLYEEEKNRVISTCCLNNHYFALRGLLLWRAKGMFDPGVEKEYELELMRVSGRPAWQLKVLAHAPRILCKLSEFPYILWAVLKKIVHFSVKLI